MYIPEPKFELELEERKMRYAFGISAFRVLGRGIIRFGLKMDHGLASGYGSTESEKTMVAETNAAALERFPLVDGWQGHNVSCTLIPEEF